MVDQGEASQLREWCNQNKCSCEVINAAQKQFSASESAVALFAEQEIMTAFVFTRVHANKQHLDKPYQEPPNPCLWHILLRMFAHTAIYLVSFFLFSFLQILNGKLLNTFILVEKLSSPLPKTVRWYLGRSHLIGCYVESRVEIKFGCTYFTEDKNKLTLVVKRKWKINNKLTNCI